MDYKKVWDEMPKISIDYAVMEKTTEAYCIKGTFDWTDLGTWVALYGLLQKDQDGNAYQGDIISFDSSNNLIISKNKLTQLPDDIVNLRQLHTIQASYNQLTQLYNRSGHE